MLTPTLLKSSKSFTTRDVDGVLRHWPTLSICSTAGETRSRGTPPYPCSTSCIRFSPWLPPFWALHLLPSWLQVHFQRLGEKQGKRFKGNTKPYPTKHTWASQARSSELIENGISVWSWFELNSDRQWPSRPGFEEPCSRPFGQPVKGWCITYSCRNSVELVNHLTFLGWYDLFFPPSKVTLKIHKESSRFYDRRVQTRSRRRLFLQLASKHLTGRFSCALWDLD